MKFARSSGHPINRKLFFMLNQNLPCNAKCIIQNMKPINFIQLCVYICVINFDLVFL
jgi:hypothetical protein